MARIFPDGKGGFILELNPASAPNQLIPHGRSGEGTEGPVATAMTSGQKGQDPPMEAQTPREERPAWWLAALQANVTVQGSASTRKRRRSDLGMKHSVFNRDPAYFVFPESTVEKFKMAYGRRGLCKQSDAFIQRAIDYFETNGCFTEDKRVTGVSIVSKILIISHKTVISASERAKAKGTTESTQLHMTSTKKLVIVEFRSSEKNEPSEFEILESDAVNGVRENGKKVECKFEQVILSAGDSEQIYHYGIFRGEFTSMRVAEIELNRLKKQQELKDILAPEANDTDQNVAEVPEAKPNLPKLVALVHKPIDEPADQKISEFDQIKTEPFDGPASSMDCSVSEFARKVSEFVKTEPLDEPAPSLDCSIMPSTSRQISRNGQPAKLDSHSPEDDNLDSDHMYDELELNGTTRMILERPREEHRNLQKRLQRYFDHDYCAMPRHRFFHGEERYPGQRYFEFPEGKPSLFKYGGTHDGLCAQSDELIRRAVDYFEANNCFTDNKHVTAASIVSKMSGIHYTNIVKASERARTKRKPGPCRCAPKRKTQKEIRKDALGRVPAEVQEQVRRQIDTWCAQEVPIRMAPLLKEVKQWAADNRIKIPPLSRNLLSDVVHTLGYGCYTKKKRAVMRHSYSYTLDFKLEAVAYAKKKSSIRSASKHFKIGRTCIRKWMNQEEFLLRKKKISTVGGGAELDEEEDDNNGYESNAEIE
ncbi:hypothetical protein Ddc_12158 [Ditylenchus destructor]|nr:hypothetical protein Ddc_12158 [Ditylenchus destructor]